MYPFKSLDGAVGFEDRVYTLGEEIDLRITLAAKRGTNIRGLVAGLFCEERWSRLAFVNERPASERFTTSSGFIGYMVDRVTDAKLLYDDVKVSRPGYGRWAEVDRDDDRQQRYALGTTHLAQGFAVSLKTIQSVLKSLKSGYMKPVPTPTLTPVPKVSGGATWYIPDIAGTVEGLKFYEGGNYGVGKENRQYLRFLMDLMLDIYISR